MLKLSIGMVLRLTRYAKCDNCGEVIYAVSVVGGSINGAPDGIKMEVWRHILNESYYCPDTPFLQNPRTMKDIPGAMVYDVNPGAEPKEGTIIG